MDSLKGTLKNIELSEKDISTIIDGLRNLPERGSTGEMMGDMLASAVISSGAVKDVDGLTKKLSEHKEKIRMERQLIQEEVDILVAKMISLKRFLAAEGLLKEASDLLKPRT